MMTLSKPKWLFLVLILLTCFIWPATGSAAESTIMKSKKVEGFVVLPDLSSSMGGDWAKGNCAGLDKLKVQFEVIRRFNAAIPQLHYVGAMRVFGIKGNLASDKNKPITRRVYGPQKFNRDDFLVEVNRLEPSYGSTPMGPAVLLVSSDLATMAGRKAVIIISDFDKSSDFGDPALEVSRLRDEYGNHVCVYTIGITSDPKAVALAKAIAAASGCGQYFDGCSMYKDTAALNAAVKTIFYEEFNVVTDPDTDMDGVPDSRDKCPNTPKGAIVDARGCWIAAYGNFFDFDKSVIKPQYLPHIQRIADVLKAYPELHVELAGHTDNVGTKKYNMELGEQRAVAVRDALVNFGVPSNRLGYRSYGETKPADDNDTERGRAMNRRVEIDVSQPGAGKK